MISFRCLFFSHKYEYYFGSLPIENVVLNARVELSYPLLSITSTDEEITYFPHVYRKVLLPHHLHASHVTLHISAYPVLIALLDDNTFVKILDDTTDTRRFVINEHPAKTDHTNY